MATEIKKDIPFKTETRQLMEILIHSLYNEREVFLRELISNASDALTRIDFEMLTNREVLNPDTELRIQIKPNPEENTLTISDTGIGMTETELIENLGTIAQSGARNFLNAVQENQTKNISDIIGHFGVGFYSTFMAAESIKVVSRSYQPEESAAAWSSSDQSTFSIEPAEKEDRGTEIIIHLREDAAEFLDENRLREIILKHSDYIPYPIYLGESKEQVNHQTALWRQQPSQVDTEEYNKFYSQFTMDFQPPFAYAHINVDAPVQMYGLLYIPENPEKNMFSPRKQEGLKLYARKVLIQEYAPDLLPKFLRFVDGVVDSEDLPLNVSREAIQSNRIIQQISKLLTNKVISTLEKLGETDPEKYVDFWGTYSDFIKEGIATDFEYYETLLPLLRFYTLKSPDKLVSLKEYTDQMKEGQDKIYYILGDDRKSILNSPHLEPFKHYDYDVLLLAAPVDPFMLLRFTQFNDFDLANITSADVELPKENETTSQEQVEDQVEGEDLTTLINIFKEKLGERVSDVRATDRLIESPARLIDPSGAISPEMQRVYHMLDKKYDIPKKILEINPKNPILLRLTTLASDDPRATDIIEQVYENALLIEGLHPDPAGMIERIQRLMLTSLKE